MLVPTDRPAARYVLSIYEYGTDVWLNQITTPPKTKIEQNTKLGLLFFEVTPHLL